MKIRKKFCPFKGSQKYYYDFSLHSFGMLEKPATMGVAPFPKLSIKNRLSTILLPWPRTMFGKELYPQKIEERTKLASFLRAEMPLKYSSLQCLLLQAESGHHAPKAPPRIISPQRTWPNIGSVVSGITDIRSLPASCLFQLCTKSSHNTRHGAAAGTAGTLPWQLGKVVAVKMITTTPFLSRQLTQKHSLQNQSCARDRCVSLRNSVLKL